MARPYKEGLEYFPVDVDIFDDEKIALIKVRYGLKGLGFIIELYRRIYRNGYYLIFGVREKEVFAYTYNEEPQQIENMINICVNEKLFDLNIYTIYGILTSKGIQERYLTILKGLRRKKIVMEKELLCMSRNNELLVFLVNAGIITVNANINPSTRIVNADINSDSILYKNINDSDNLSTRIVNADDNQVNVGINGVNVGINPLNKTKLNKIKEEKRENCQQLGSDKQDSENPQKNKSLSFSFLNFPEAMNEARQRGIDYINVYNKIFVKTLKKPLGYADDNFLKAFATMLMTGYEIKSIQNDYISACKIVREHSVLKPPDSIIKNMQKINSGTMADIYWEQGRDENIESASPEYIPAHPPEQIAQWKREKAERRKEDMEKYPEQYNENGDYIGVKPKVVKEDKNKKKTNKSK